MANCIDTGFPQFSCALVQKRYSTGENGCGHIRKGADLWREDGETGQKEGNRNRRWGYVKGNSRIGGI